MPPAPKPNLVKLSSLDPADAARLTAVRNLLEAQGRHDLPAILASFGSQPTLEFAGGPRHIGAERVGQIYGDLLRAFPDLTIEVLAEHVADRSIVVEMVLQGTHRQQWLGMAPRGRPLSLPVCNVFLFDKRDQISALRIYLDRNLAIVQLTSGLLR
ncbi:MAG TPA: nuclear transport factor 2 family protein [Dongiaceae bacterium]|nr:nuclear transport factor 2 family protein [Dongiaceae bacterium]